MNIDTIIETTPAPATGPEFLKTVQLLIDADDMTTSDRESLAAGFLMGIAYALATCNENGDTAKQDIAQTMLKLKHEWESRGLA